MTTIRPADIAVCARYVSTKTAVLTIDVEKDFGGNDTYALSRIARLIDLLDGLNIPLTAFIEGRILESMPGFCCRLYKRSVDIQLHCYDHTTFGDDEESLKRSVAAFATVFGRRPHGYRAHTYRLNLDLYRFLTNEGFRWDSSILPAFSPGGNLSWVRQRGDYFEFDNAFLEFPVATWRRLAIPLSHPYRLLLKPVGEKLLRSVSGPPKLVVYNMHMVDLIVAPTLESSPLSPLVRLIYRYIWGGGDDTLVSLEDFIGYLRRLGYRFRSMAELYDEVRG